METQGKKNVNSTEQDIDLGDMFVLLSKGLRKTSHYIKLFFSTIFHSIVLTLLYIKKRIIWLLLAIIIGYGIGLYLSKAEGDKYYSYMIAKINFGGIHAVYNTAEYLNSLVNESNFQELSKILVITEENAKKLKYFEVEPIEDEASLSSLYKQRFLDFKRNQQYRTDTFWTRSLSYEDFKKDISKYDIPMQKITVTSTQSNIFRKIQQGLVNIITSNGVLKKTQAITQKTRFDQEEIILSSLQSLDSLRTSYNKRISASSPSQINTNLTVLEQPLQSVSPEIQLYEKVLQFKDELNGIRNEGIDNLEIIQIYAEFNPVGKKVSVLKQNSVKYSMRVLVFTFLALLLIDLYTVLNLYEKLKKSRSQK